MLSSMLVLGIPHSAGLQEVPAQYLKAVHRQPTTGRIGVMHYLQVLSQTSFRPVPSSGTYMVSCAPYRMSPLAEYNMTIWKASSLLLHARPRRHQSGWQNACCGQSHHLYQQSAWLLALHVDIRSAIQAMLEDLKNRQHKIEAQRDRCRTACHMSEVQASREAIQEGIEKATMECKKVKSRLAQIEDVNAEIIESIEVCSR